MQRLKALLDKAYETYNKPSFIDDDPIQIPHRFSRREDIETAAFLTTQIAWGKRRMIINSAAKLMDLMDNNPSDFIRSASAKDMMRLDCFVHRTFNADDCRTGILCLRHICKTHGSLGNYFEKTFAREKSVFSTLAQFRRDFLAADHEPRFTRHISDVTRNSAAKRLNLFLVWMCRKDGRRVHFGLWDIPASALMIPLDIHVGNVSRSLGLLSRKQNDWKAVEELTNNLRRFDPEDPTKYDFALFGMGVLGNIELFKT